MTEKTILAMIAGVVFMGSIAAIAKCSTELVKNSWKDICISAGYEVIDGKSCKKK